MRLWPRRSRRAEPRHAAWTVDYPTAGEGQVSRAEDLNHWDHWLDGPTELLPMHGPLMTRGQAWRSRKGQR